MLPVLLPSERSTHAVHGWYLNALGGTKTVVDDATQAFVKGDLGQLVKTPGKLLGVFQQLKGGQVMESLFGDAFRDLSDQAQGLSPLKAASEYMADALDALPPHLAGASTALDAVAPPAKLAADALGDLTRQAKATVDALTGVGAPAPIATAAPAPQGVAATAGVLTESLT